MRNTLLILIFFASLLTSSQMGAQTVVLKTDTITVPCNATDTFLVPVRVQNFTNIGGLQFTLSWNAGNLDYAYVTQINPAFQGVGFDTSTFINQGKLSFAWTDIGGLSLPDNSIVFSVAMARIGGPFTPVTFVSTPTEIVVVDKLGNELSFQVMAGGVNPVDAVAPVITCPANQTVQSNGPAVVNNIAPQSVSDNCGTPAVGWSASGATTSNFPSDPDASGTAFNLGQTVVTYLASDVGGNTASCSFQVNVELSADNDSLTIIAGNATASCGQQIIGVDITALNFDSLGGLQFSLGWNTSVLQYSSVGNFNPALFLDNNNFGTTQVNAGYLSLAWTTAALEGTSLPDGAVLFRVFFTVSGGNGSSTGIQFGDFPTERVAVSVATIPAEEIGFITIAGLVTVADLTPPTVACPANVTVTAPTGNTSANVTNLQPATLTDNCGNVQLAYAISGASTGQGQGPANGTYNAGLSTVAYTATDAAGNTSTCAFTVTVNLDATNLLTLTLDTIAADCQGTQQIAVNISVTNFQDIIGLQFSVNWDETVLQFDSVGNQFPGLNLTATNFFNYGTVNNGLLRFFGGNAAGWPPIPDDGVFFTLYFTVLNPGGTSNIDFVGPFDAVNKSFNSVPLATVSGYFSSSADNSAPVITFCPPDVTVDAVASECNANVQLAALLAFDACSGIDTVALDPPGNVFNAGITTVIFTVTDNAGNTATCAAQVTVLETMPPQIFNCPANTTVAAASDGCDAKVSWQLPQAFDACSSVAEFSGSANPGDLFPVGDSTVVYTATDDLGNSSTCAFIVTVRDTTPPTVTCPANLTVDPANPEDCFAVVDFVVNAVDNCDTALTIGGNTNPGQPFGVGETQVIALAEDDFGNFATCSFTITVTDKQAPTILCPPDFSVSTSASGCTANPDWDLPIVTDNCVSTVPSLTATPAVAPGDEFQVGKTTIVYKATDDFDNASTCSFTITVVEAQAPVISNCPGNITIFLPATACDSMVSWPVPTATDNCGQVSLNAQPASGTNFMAGTTAVTYTATDAAGNTSTCAFSVTLKDQVAPVLAPCPNNVTVNDASPCGENVNWSLPAATDNCDPEPLVTSTKALNEPFLPGTTVVLITVEDASGNSDSCTFKVVINATQNQGFSNIPANITVTADSGCDDVVEWPPLKVTGYCQQPVVDSNFASGSTFPVGTTTVIYTATDQNGATITATFTITVQETTPPTITCPGGLTVNAGGAILSGPAGIVLAVDTVANCTGVELTLALPTATDNCGAPTVTQLAGPQPGAVYPIGTQTLSFQAKDASGNTAICSFSVEVVDLLPVSPQADPNPACATDIVTVTADSIPGADYVWTGPTGLLDDSTHQIMILLGGDNTGVYTVQANINGCLTPKDSVDVQLVSSTIQLQNDVYQVDVNGALDSFYVFVNDNLFPPTDFTITIQPESVTGLTYLGNGYFSYQATTQNVSFLYSVCSMSCPNVCSQTPAKVDILVKDISCTELPNIFTPNGDLDNETFLIECLEPEPDRQFPNSSLVVYNQWGDKVFEASPYKNDWHGTLKNEDGKNLPDGVYYYVFKSAPNATPSKGFVQIFR